MCKQREGSLKGSLLAVAHPTFDVVDGSGWKTLHIGRKINHFRNLSDALCNVGRELPGPSS